MKKQRVMVFGTFDVIHPGHASLFKQARSLVDNPYLIVSVARDVNVARIKKQPPLHNERQRLRMVQKLSLVDKAVLGGITDHIPHIVRERPEIIALGYDQRNYVRGLKTALIETGLLTRIVRLQPFKPQQYKSSLIKRRLV